MVTLVAALKPCAIAVVTVTSAMLLALPAVRVIDATVRVGMPVAVIVPVAGDAGMIVTVEMLVAEAEVTVALKHTTRVELFAVPVEQDICRLQIAMENAVLVSVVDGARNCRNQASSLLFSVAADVRRL